MHNWQHRATGIIYLWKDSATSLSFCRIPFFCTVYFSWSKFKRAARENPLSKKKPKMSKKKCVPSLLLVCLLRILTLDFASAEKAGGERKTISVMLETSGMIFKLIAMVITLGQVLICRMAISQICGRTAGCQHARHGGCLKDWLVMTCCLYCSKSFIPIVVIKLICGRREEGIESKHNCRAKEITQTLSTPRSDFSRPCGFGIHVGFELYLESVMRVPTSGSIIMVAVRIITVVVDEI